MYEDVKIFTSHDKSAVEKFIKDSANEGYYRENFLTNVIYDSFQFSGAYKIHYTVIMVKYKQDPIMQNMPLYSNQEQDVVTVGVKGDLPVATEQIHSEKGGRGKKGKNIKEEMSTTTDSTSIHES